jgi:hypothetical protein
MRGSEKMSIAIRSILETAIRDSIREDRTVAVDVEDVTIALDELATLGSDDSADLAPGVTDVWGETDDGDTWRLMLTVAQVAD